MKEEIIKEINAMLLYNNIDVSENEVAALSNKILNILNGEKEEEIEHITSAGSLHLKRKVRKAKRIIKNDDDDDYRRIYDEPSWMW